MLAADEAPGQDFAGKVVYRGRPVPGAVVTVRQGEKQFTVVTDEAGVFVVKGAGAGAAEVEVRMFGFEPLKRTVQEGGRDRLELALSIPALRNGAAGPAEGAGQTAVETLETQISRALQPSAVTGADSSDASESFLVQGSLSRGLQEAGRPGCFEFGFAGPMMAGLFGPGGMPGGPPAPEAALAGGPGPVRGAPGMVPGGLWAARPAVR